MHELAHALADQRFNLDRYIKQARKSDDGALARMAVMEGQATWLMSEYLARRMGQSLASSPELMAMMSRSAESISGQFPVFDGVPLYMRETLIFPYGKGMLFQQALHQKQGTAAFAEVFRRPPVSTQQMLHPEKYFAGAQPTRPPLPELPEARGYKALIDGGFGELDHAILLEQYAGKDAAARGGAALAGQPVPPARKPRPRSASCWLMFRSGTPRRPPGASSLSTRMCCGRSGRSSTRAPPRPDVFAGAGRRRLFPRRTPRRHGHQPRRRRSSSAVN